MFDTNSNIQPVDDSRLTPELNGHSNDTSLVDEGGHEEPTSPEGEHAVSETTMDSHEGEETSQSPEDLQAAYDALLAERDTLAERYKNMQADNTRSRQRLAMYEKTRRQEDYDYAVQPTQYQPGNYIPDMNQFLYGTPPQQQMAQSQPIVPHQARVAVDAATIQLAADQKVAELKLQDPEFDEVSPVLWTLITEDPYFKDIEFTDVAITQNTIGLAYSVAKQQLQQAKSNVTVNKARQDAYNNKQAKLLNNDNSGKVASKATNQGTKKTKSEEIRDSILGVTPQKF